MFRSTSTWRRWSDFTRPGPAGGAGRIHEATDLVWRAADGVASSSARQVLPHRGPRRGGASAACRKPPLLDQSNRQRPAIAAEQRPHRSASTRGQQLVRSRQPLASICTRRRELTAFARDAAKCPTAQIHAVGKAQAMRSPGCDAQLRSRGRDANLIGELSVVHDRPRSDRPARVIVPPRRAGDDLGQQRYRECHEECRARWRDKDGARTAMQTRRESEAALIKAYP